MMSRHLKRKTLSNFKRIKLLKNIHNSLTTPHPLTIQRPANTHSNITKGRRTTSGHIARTKPKFPQEKIHIFNIQKNSIYTTTCRAIHLYSVRYNVGETYKQLKKCAMCEKKKIIKHKNANVHNKYLRYDIYKIGM